MSLSGFAFQARSQMATSNATGVSRRQSNERIPTAYGLATQTPAGTPARAAASVRPSSTVERISVRAVYSTTTIDRGAQGGGARSRHGGGAVCAAARPLLGMRVRSVREQPLRDHARSAEVRRPCPAMLAHRRCRRELTRLLHRLVTQHTSGRKLRANRSSSGIVKTFPVCSDATMCQPLTRATIYKGYRFPPDIISRCVWLY